MPLPSTPIDQITQIATSSNILSYYWRDRGHAPTGYIKGMAVVYALVYCKFKSGDLVAVEMAKANTNNFDTDALSWYNEEFLNIGLNNDSNSVDTLRHLFVLLIGLGMRESSGIFCAGRDSTASNISSDTAEAGLFQTSYNARKASPLLPIIFNRYLANPLGFIEIFREHITCSPNNLKNYGSGPGEQFQRLSKECPAFAVEFAGVGLRNIRKHWGPVIRKEVEILPECDEMLLQIQNEVEALNLCSYFHSLLI